MDSNKQDMEEKRLHERCKELHAETVRLRLVMRNLERLIHMQAQLEGANNIRRANEEAEAAQLKESVHRLKADNVTLEESRERLNSLHKQQHTVLQEHYGERRRLERENEKLKKLLKQRNAKLRTVDAAAWAAGAAAERLAKKGA